MNLAVDSETILPIDSMPFLAERLGKSRVDLVRSVQKPMPRAKGSRNFLNPIQADMQCLIREPKKVSDIIIGICRSIDPAGNLNHKRVIVLLKTLDSIDSRRVQHVTLLGERQVRRYVQACRIALPHLIKYFSENPVRFDDPHTLI